jgi:tRNA 2-thiouridine synthesizing protein A
MEREIDVKGMNCPLPVLRAKKALRGLEIGETLRIYATDPSTVNDMSMLCKTAGHELVDSKESDGVFTYVIKRGQ